MRIEPLEERRLLALTAKLLDDINPNGGSGPTDFVGSNGLVFFSADDGIHGRELWVTDGTELDTKMVKDIYARIGELYSSSPANLTDINGTLFFTADDGTHGIEIWKSNGTVAGTVMVTDINETDNLFGQTSLTVGGAKLFFLENTGGITPSLWEISGPDGGAFQLPASLFPYPLYGFGNLTPFAGGLIFTAQHSNGTIVDTDVWRTDGTPNGTALLATLPGGPVDGVRWIVNAGGQLFFAAGNEGNIGANELYVSDGTASRTQLLGTFASIGRADENESPTSIGTELYFAADDGTTGLELWKSNGIASGTALVKDIDPTVDAYIGYPNSSNPQSLTAAGGTLFFTAASNIANCQLWKSDGSNGGTTEVVPNGSLTLNAGGLASARSELFFEQFGSFDLCATDGTSGGTALVSDPSGNAIECATVPLTNVGGTFYLSGSNGSTGLEPYIVTSPAPPPPTNQAPNFTAGPNQTVDENAGPQTVTGWATNISPGSGPGDFGQTLDFIVSADNPSLFSAEPAIDASGTLTYTPAPNTTGTATVTVRLHDNGGVTDGGVDTSPPQIFTISVLGPANRAPRFLAGPDQVVDENAGQQTVIGWATQISPGDGPDDAGQTLNFITSLQSTTNPNLFSVQPFLDSSGTLHYAPTDNQSGLATISVRLHDNGGTTNGGVDTSAPQIFTIGVRGPTKILSPNRATFTVGQRGSFTVIASGFPFPTFTLSGTLPTGVTFDPNTGVIAGMPASGTGDPYPITITADNGFGHDEQAFTLNVDEAPAIVSDNHATFAVGVAGSFQLAASGLPQSVWTYSGSLPAGITFDGSQGLLSGTPEAYTGGPYSLTFRANNGVGQAAQSFTLTVDQPPAITSAASAVFVVGAAGSFLLNATGYPEAAYQESGKLPDGVTFHSDTGVLSGTPVAKTGGDYPLTLTATNGIAPAATQNFVLHVHQAPSFTTQGSATFATGGENSLAILADGVPKPTVSIAGSLPPGVDFDAASGELSGTPPVGTRGSYAVTFTADNGVGEDAVLSFTLNVVDSHGLDLAVVPNGTSVAMDHFYWNSDAAGGGFTFTYNVTNPLGAPIPGTTIDFDWATGPDVNDVISGAAAYRYLIAATDRKTPGLHTITVTQNELIAGHGSPPPINGGLGTATDLVMRIDPPYPNEPSGLVQETDETNNVAVLRVVPLVVDVLSHGFKPDSGESWSDFRQPWYDLASELSHVPAPDSTLDHRVAEYVTKWDSSAVFLNGFYALLASKVASAEAQLALVSLDPDGAAFWGSVSGIALAVAAASAEGSDQLLEQAARQVVDDLETPGGNLLPPPQSNVLQHIELIGHSRGAALNAEVARLLWQDGYRNMDYTALDGYSSDWPDNGGILTNIDIAKETAMLGDQRIFYRVQEGLEHDPAIVNNMLISALLGTQLDIVQAENDLRSPERSGSDPIVLPAGGYTISAHTTIEPIYASQPMYYEDDYVGQHRDDGLATASSSAQISMAVALAGVSPGAMLSAGTAAGNVSPANIGTASSSEYESAFVDGSLQQLAALNAEIAAANLPTGPTAFDQFFQQIADPAYQISLFWQATGDVSLVNISGTPALQLTDTAGADASISQSVVLPDSATDVAFDLGVTAASPDSVLEISYAGSVIQSVSLAAISGSQRVDVPLPDEVPDSGQFTFLLTSASQAPATITLTNLTIDSAANTAPTFTAATLSLPKTNSGSSDASNIGAEVATLLGGIIDPDPGAVAGIAVVGADTADGTAQYSLDGGTTWQNIGAVSDTSALLLDGGPLTRLRFLPNPGVAGQLNSVLTVRAWDETTGLSGIARERFSITDTGDPSPFSRQTAAVAIDIVPTLHVPSVSSAITYESQQTTSGLVVAPNAADGAWAAYFQISGINGGRLFLNDGVTPLADGDFITEAQGVAGLRFTPAAGAESGRFQVQASTTADGSGLGGQPATAQIIVLPNNHAPSFTVGRGFVLLSGDRPLTFASWATNISPGPGANDAGQQLAFGVTNDNNSLFSVQPTLDANGNLRFTPNAKTAGSATVTVVLHDDGGTDHGGVDTSLARSFTISIINFAQGDNAYVIGSGTITVPANIGLLANDSGQGQLTVTAGSQAGAEGGTFALNADGSFTYTPPASFPGFDYTRYVVGDAEGGLAGATVTVLSQTGGVVWKFYESVLGRNPDYAGLQGWINDFSNGGMPGDIAAGFFESTELLDQVISGYYQQYLGRAPHDDDLDFWGREWRENGGPELIKAQFASSQEFNALANNLYGAYPDGWITALYERILNRAPEPGALPFWEKQLAGGTTEGQVTLEFFTSPEAFGNDVSAWFKEYLGRAPSAAEEQKYANLMLGGASDRDIEQAITNLPDYSADPPNEPAGTAAPLPDYFRQSGPSSSDQQALVSAQDEFFTRLGQ